MTVFVLVQSSAPSVPAGDGGALPARTGGGGLQHRSAPTTSTLQRAEPRRQHAPGTFGRSARQTAGLRRVYRSVEATANDGPPRAAGFRVSGLHRRCRPTLAACRPCGARYSADAPRGHCTLRICPSRFLRTTWWFSISISLWSRRFVGVVYVRIPEPVRSLQAASVNVCHDTDDCGERLCRSYLPGAFVGDRSCHSVALAATPPVVADDGLVVRSRVQVHPKLCLGPSILLLPRAQNGPARSTSVIRHRVVSSGVTWLPSGRSALTTRRRGFCSCPTGTFVR